ncbi:MAG TPA: protocatechuate 3,4-dioxygenase subunit alpha [Geminicoccaceae bacterium]
MAALPYLKETASQTAGPYLHIGMAPAVAGLAMRSQEKLNVLAGAGTEGERIRIEGRVIDGSGAPLRDAQVEIWQANAHGRYNHPADTRDRPLDQGFRGWGRAVTDFETGLFWFETIKPGRVPGRHGHKEMAPHVSLWIVARGINIGLSTRMYFGDESSANAEDPVLRLIEPAERRRTLIAAREERADGIAYRFDIRLQGEDETVFFDV